jgi:Domain of unknown function (DUF4440)
MKPMLARMTVGRVRRISCAALLGSVVLTSACSTMEPAASQLSEVESVERARFAAFTSVDIGTLRRTLADDLVYCHTSAECQNKEQVIADLGSRDRIYHSIDVLELRPRAVAGAVLIHGKLALRVERAGKGQQFQLVYSDVYVKRDGRWQMTSWQSTRLP